VSRHAKDFVKSLTPSQKNALRVLIVTELKSLRHELQMSNVAVMTEGDRRVALAKQGRTIELFPETMRRPQVVNVHVED